MSQPLYRHNAGLFLADLATYETDETAFVTSEAPVMLDDPEPADAGRIDPVTASFRNELARYTYKPGVTLTIEPPMVVPDGKSYDLFILRHTGQPRLRVEMQVPDSRNTTTVYPPRIELGAGGKPQAVTARKLIPVSLVRTVPETLIEREWLTREERSERFAWFLREALEEVELHEMREWWRRDGDLVDDPHAKAAPSTVGPIR